MSSQDIAKQFRIFGYKIIPIVILATLSFLFLLVNLTNNTWIFYFDVWLVFAILFQIFISIFFFFTLGNINKTANYLNYSELDRFSKKIISMSVMRIIGYLLIILCVPTLLTLPPLGKLTDAQISLLADLIIGLVIAYILLLIAAIFEFKAWKILNETFSMYVKDNNAQVGTTFCMVGAILDATTILRFISDIFRIIGYYFLIFNLRNITDDNITPPSHPHYQPVQPQSAVVAPSIRFCPNCGSNLKGTENFCTSCGTGL